jgi:site-specific recombinase
VPAAGPLDPELAYLSVYPEGLRKRRRVRDLGRLLGRLVGAGDDEAFVHALAALARWICQPDRRLPLPPGVPIDVGPAQRRMQVVLALLAIPEVTAAVRNRLGSFVASADGLRLFAEVGLPNDRGLVPETADRLLRRLLPTPRDDRDLAAVLPRLIVNKTQLAQFEALGLDAFTRLAELLGAGDPDAKTWNPLMRSLADAIVLLAARVQGLGLAEGMRDRTRPGPISDSPFFQLPRAADRFLSLRDELVARLGAERNFRATIAGCRTELRAVLTRLETAGVSLDVVYSIEVIERALTRLEHLIAVVIAAPGEERARTAFALVIVLARSGISDGSLRALAYSNLNVLARKIVERAGQTGEHYITTTRRAFFSMFARGIGGGFVTNFTAAGKLLVSGVGLAPFVSGIAASTVYAVSFVLIQLFGFSLATKQPSMTAATLAATIGRGGGREFGEVVNQTACIVRSQLAAAIGNVATVSFCAVVTDVAVRANTGHSLLDTFRAEDVFASLHPTRSGTAIYAMLTGVILWAASLAGGWIENFAVYRRLPQAIAEHRVGRFIGRRPLAWAAGYFARNISGIGGSVALGVMLGMTPPIGAFFGLPLDVRHVTLATGQLAFAIAEGGTVNLSRPEVGWAAAGIALTFVLNLGTSFFLALTVALRARQVPQRDRWALVRAIAQHFFRHPRAFFWPPRYDPVPASKATAASAQPASASSPSE